MVKRTIVLGLILVAIGIFVAPVLTKNVLKITGGATVDTTKAVVEEIRESPEVQEKFQRFKAEVNESVEDLERSS